MFVLVSVSHRQGDPSDVTVHKDLFKSVMLAKAELMHTVKKDTEWKEHYDGSIRAEVDIGLKGSGHYMEFIIRELRGG